MKKRTWNLMFAWLALGTLTLSYNNCAMKAEVAPGDENKTESSSVSTPSSGEDLCEDDLLRVFANGYHKFLKENCSVCHSTGPGKGRFANADAKIALEDFSQIGYSKVSTNATSSTHNPPYSGPQHIQTVNDLKFGWQKGQEDFARCKGSVDLPPSSVPVEDLITYELKAQVVPVMNFNEEKEMTWIVNQDLFRIDGTNELPNLPNAKVSLKIAKHKTGGNDEYYTLRAPTLWDSQVDAHIKGLHAKINGVLLKNPTTFKFVDRDIRAGSKNDASGVITTGALVIPGKTFDVDKISIVIEDLKAVKLPDPKPPITAQFSGSLAQLAPTTGDRIVNIDVTLSEAPVDPVSVSVVEDSAKICNSDDPVDLTTKAGCLPSVVSLVCPTADPTCAAGLNLLKARSIVGTTYNRYDWDYRFQSSTLIFFPGETKKTIQVRFSKDIRKENNRLLSLKLELGLGDIVLGGNSSKHFVIQKVNNPTPPIGVARYQDLMHPKNGILFTNCIECHNSTKREGQYDITNYDEMVERGVLVPGSTTSKMFRRINPTDSEWSNLLGMPRKGPMEDPYIRAVQKWIEAGAPNN